ncbi:SanA/YdcF family protein [Flavitalea sp.]|nr:ElyC/SanA/YdcF family protein [Flavitalea sp.]
MRKRFTVIYVAAGLLLSVLLIVIICNAKVENAAAGKTFSKVGDVPYNKVGLVLGTGKTLEGGFINPYYQYRVNAAVELWKKNKIQSIIISGDNSTTDYNEPGDFRQDLIKLGVDSNHIYLDYAGFRTFDSMVRLKKIFGQDSVTVISQEFHNERALYIAKREGIVAVGFNARDVNAKQGIKVQAREKLARVKLFVDYLVGTEPKFLGKKVNIQ